QLDLLDHEPAVRLDPARHAHIAPPLTIGGTALRGGGELERATHFLGIEVIQHEMTAARERLHNLPDHQPMLRVIEKVAERREEIYRETKARGPERQRPHVAAHEWRAGALARAAQHRARQIE